MCLTCIKNFIRRQFFSRCYALQQRKQPEAIGTPKMLSPLFPNQFLCRKESRIGGMPGTFAHHERVWAFVWKVPDDEGVSFAIFRVVVRGATFAQNVIAARLVTHFSLSSADRSQTPAAVSVLDL